MLTLNDGRSELWQWDTGRTLAVDADCSQVHFSNKVFGRSIDVDASDGVVIIPDILLQTDKDLNVWAFVGTAENGYTKISKTFKVNRRNKPSDYVFTPPDQTSLEEIKERIDALEEKQDPDAIKNAVEDYLEQNPVEVPVQSVNGQTGEVKLTAGDVGAISQDDLQEATNEALAKAKESGEFDGEPGRDYVLTDEDKAEIAELAAELVEIPDSGGNVAYDEEQELTEEQKAQARANIGAQPVGEYLTEVPEGYAKNEDIKKVDRKVDTLREVVSKFHSNIVCDSKGEVITVSDASDMELSGLRIFGKTTQNGTPTPEAPIDIKSVENPTVKVCGKNLYEIDTIISSTTKAVIERLGEKTIRLYTLESASYVASKASFLLFRKGITYTISCNVDNIVSGYIAIALRNATGMIQKSLRITTTGKRSFVYTPTEDVEAYLSLFVTFDTVEMGDATFSDIQIEVGSNATDFEAYKDGGSVTVSAPNGLPGIPVASGGNYTDENGQQWICDEVDFGKGVYVQRVGEVVLDGDEAVGIETYDNTYKRIYYKLDNVDLTTAKRTAVLSNRFGLFKGTITYGIAMVSGSGYLLLYLSESLQDLTSATQWLTENPTTTQYILATPIETALSAEELAAYAALHTNYPNTTVYNDGGAGMEVKYVADTKLYVDKKFAELSAALLNQ